VDWHGFHVLGAFATLSPTLRKHETREPLNFLSLHMVLGTSTSTKTVQSRQFTFRLGTMLKNDFTERNVCISTRISLNSLSARKMFRARTVEKYILKTHTPSPQVLRFSKSKRCYMHILDVSNAIIENALREKSRISKAETKKGSLYYL
jgi:hypothetical protein